MTLAAVGFNKHFRDEAISQAQGRVQDAINTKIEASPLFEKSLAFMIEPTNMKAMVLKKITLCNLRYTLELKAYLMQVYLL